MIKDYARLAIRNLLRRGLRSWLTMIGIFLGIAAIVALISLSQGLKTTITGQFALLGTEDIVIQAQGSGGGPPGTGVSNTLTEDTIGELKLVTGVEETLGRIIDSAEIEHDDIVEFALAGSFPEDKDELDLLYSTNVYDVEQGRQLETGDTFSVMIGADVAAEGKIFDKGIQLRDKIIINDQKFQVIGIIKKSGSFIVDNQVGIMEDTMRDLYDREDGVDIILARLGKGQDMNLVSERIRNKMRDIRDVDKGDEDFTVETPETRFNTVNDILIGVQVFVVFIAFISLVVGGIGIMNTMYTSVVERRKEIGIMKSIGGTNTAIFSLFFIESGLLGLLGGVVGTIFGAALGGLFAFAGRLALGSDLIQAHFSLDLIIGALFFSFIVGTLAGTLPAVRASRLHPVEALRK